ncbi:hypothetical protein [Ruegeria sp. HKCCSP335]|uniref:hypothetical protein n=1 Tax=Ruegeria sp. HKCCSP335 TaxID=2794833 RepID=UPI001AE52FED|nr:hypothetical protein [Ruegeria sp. HKCCSP335]
MTLMAHFPAAIAAAMPLPHATQIVEAHEVNPAPQPEIAAPFARTQNLVLYSPDLRSVFLREQYFESSSASASAVLVTVESADQSPAELVQEFKRLSGLTWAQVAHVFEVSSRAPFDWASGKPVNAKNHEKLASAVAAIRFIDRGASEENRNLLLSEAVDGQTYLNLLQSAEFERVREIAGKGDGRPSFGQKLTAEASKFNAPRHFGANMEDVATGDDSEILPVSKPKLRRAKARRNKA